jgi:CDGSH-type Zn-finger protein
MVGKNFPDIFIKQREVKRKVMANRRKPFQKPPNDKVKIKVSKNGPYLISGEIPLEENTIIRDSEGISYEWRAGKKYPAQRDCALCCCGHSKNPPFCDEYHRRIQFDGTETAGKEPYLDQAKRINGPELELTDAHHLCAHATFCDRASGIWELTRQSNDPEAKRLAVEEAGDCPSGRLVVWDKDGNDIEPEFEPSIELVEDPQKGVSGPLWVKGCIPIESADGTKYEVHNRVTLCRCGQSANKPFCDGTHLNK